MTKTSVVSAASDLKQYIPSQGGQVFVIVRGVSRSGMSRTMSFFVIDPDTRPLPTVLDLTYHLAKLTGRRVDRKTGGVIVRSSGDWRFSVMDDVMGALYGKSGNDVSINVL